MHEGANKQQYQKVIGMVETSSREMHGKEASAIQVAN